MILENAGGTRKVAAMGENLFPYSRVLDPGERG